MQPYVLHKQNITNERLLIMKRLIILTIATIFTLGLFAQSNSVVTENIKGDGYTYVKETLNNTLKIKLYNKENKYANVPLVYKDTGESPDYDLQENRVEDDDWTSDLLAGFASSHLGIVEERSLSVFPT